ALESLTTTLNAVLILTVYLKAILPGYASRIEKLLNVGSLQWSDLGRELEEHKINDFERLMERIDNKKVEAMIEETKAQQAAASVGAEPAKENILAAEPLAEQIEIDDFLKVDLRVVKIISAEAVVESDKLVKLQVDLGGEQRQILAGIRKAYMPEDLVGRNVVICANLKPRKMKFGISEGMILAAGSGGEDIFISSPDEGAKPGQRLH
ncbi:MAG: methionine--tRNA ligase subunit beta, partial [Sedimentisphaerales bacterium]|nr:methionine--tRNA ligase subunit beta [Sedimentisphaerales bacterium]